MSTLKDIKPHQTVTFETDNGENIKIDFVTFYNYIIFQHIMPPKKKFSVLL